MAAAIVLVVAHLVAFGGLVGFGVPLVMAFGSVIVVLVKHLRRDLRL